MENLFFTCIIYVLLKVCEGLALELLEAKISVWPGYLRTQPTALEQLTAR